MSYHLFRRVLDIGDPFIVQKIFNSWSFTRVLHETLSYEIFGLGRAIRYQIEFGRFIQNLVFYDRLRDARERVLLSTRK